MPSKKAQSKTSSTPQMSKEDYKRQWAEAASELLVREIYQRALDPSKIDLGTKVGVMRLRAVLSGNGGIFDRARPAKTFVLCSVPDVMPVFLKALVRKKPELGGVCPDFTVEAKSVPVLQLAS